MPPTGTPDWYGALVSFRGAVPKGATKGQILTFVLNGVLYYQRDTFLSKGPQSDTKQKNLPETFSGQVFQKL